MKLRQREMHYLDPMPSANKVGAPMREEIVLHVALKGFIVRYPNSHEAALAMKVIPKWERR